MPIPVLVTVKGVFMAWTRRQLAGIPVLASEAIAYLPWRRRKRWLSYHVERELGSLERQSALKESFLTRDGLRWIQRHLASGWSLLAVPVAGLLLHTLLAVSARFAFPSGWCRSGWSGFLSDLWQVQASILSITFIVIVLLVQARVVNLGREDLVGLYIRKSYVIPSAVAGLALTGTIGAAQLLIKQADPPGAWENALALSSVVIFALFLWVTAGLHWTTLQFLRPSWIRRQRFQFLERVLLEAVRREIGMALGRVTLQRVCRDLELLYAPLGSSRQDLAPIRADRSGEVVDVDLRNLRRFAQVLAHRVPLTGSPDDSPKAFLVKEIGSRVTPGNDVLARIHRRDLSDRAGRLLRSVYKISPRERHTDDN